MKLSRLTVAATAVATLCMGCVDDDYDLSEIDGTAQFSLKELVLPLNLDSITLSDVLDIEEGSRIQIMNGEYVLSEEGTFTSENIKIDRIHVDAPVVDPSVSDINLDESFKELLPKNTTIDEIPEIWYNIQKSENASHFDYEVGDVSDHITSIDAAEVELMMTINMKVTGLESYINGFDFEDMVFQFPKGLTLDYNRDNYEYDFDSGEFKFKDDYVGKVTGNTYELNVVATRIDFHKANAKFDANAHRMIFADDVAIESGRVHLTKDDFKAGHDFSDMPHDCVFELSFEFSDLTVTKFSGGVQYAIDGIDIAPIEMTNIPDFLNQEGTNITLNNPQLYLTVNNPVAPFGLAPHAGLTVTQMRGENEGNSYTIDNGEFFFGTAQGNTDYNYCLAPAMPSLLQPGYENSEFVAFTNLKDIVSGEGLPSSLKVSVENPGIDGTATDFTLDQEMELHGKYLFYAPLNLAEGSMIVYSDTRDGWSDEDLDKMVLSKIEISATVSSDIPFSVKLDGYPINTAGERINANVEGVDIEANAASEDIVIRITGTVADLDGITFTATAVSDGTKTLSPNQSLVLKNVKVKVSGNYTDEF